MPNPESPIIADSKILMLNKRILSCELCRLCKKRTKAVPGNGPVQKVNIMFVGEAPGRNEDLQGEPFVGRGGKILDSALEIAGVNRHEVYVTNIVKCRPPENRKPLKDEVGICTKNYLELQIELLRPRLIVALGATSLEYFTGEKSIGKLRGKIARTKSGLLLFPAYHPAAILRNKLLKTRFENDIKQIALISRGLENGRKSA